MTQYEISRASFQVCEHIVPAEDQHPSLTSYENDDSLRNEDRTHNSGTI